MPLRPAFILRALDLISPFYGADSAAALWPVYCHGWLGVRLIKLRRFEYILFRPVDAKPLGPPTTTLNSA